jgi:hypothetical protein
MTRLALSLTCALAVAAPAAAQMEAAIDVAYDHDFVWRGLTRVSRPAFQPAVAVAWKSPSLLVSAGSWALLEPWQPHADDLTLAGRDGGLGQVDVWAEAAYRLRILSLVLDARGGWTRYTYHADTDDGIASDRNTSELYLGLSLAGLRQLYTVLGLPDLPVGVEASAAFDVGDIGGTYLETGLVAELPILFVGEPLGATVVRLTTGWSWNQELGAPEGGYYAGEGLTHVTLAGGVTPFLHVGPVPTTLHLGGTVQYGVDEATRRRGFGPEDRSRWIGWIDVTFSVLFPLRRVE